MLYLRPTLHKTHWFRENTNLIINSMRQNPLEKQIVTQLVKKFTAFYGTRRFITVFTRACLWSLSSDECIPQLPIHFLVRSIEVLSSHLRLCFPRGLFPSGFSDQNFVCISLLYHSCYVPNRLIFLDFIIIIFDEAYELWSSIGIGI